MALVLVLALAASAAGAADTHDAAYRYSAPITVTQPGAFVHLPLPASAYGRSVQSGLNDLRVVDARGERVPFALLAPRADKTQDSEQQRDAVLYPLPRKPAAGQAWASPVEVVVQGDRISVRRLGGKTAPVGVQSAAPGAVPGSPGWLIDLGEARERPRDEPPPKLLRLAWSGPAEFSATFDFELSEDLRTWRRGGSGQVMALASASGPLTQATVVLPSPAARFLRLVWLDATTAPLLTGAKAVVPRQSRVAVDAPTELQFSASPEPAGKKGVDEASARALHFDLGGALPLVQLQLQHLSGTRVAPVRVQARVNPDEVWRDLAQSVFYRLERGDAVSESPPLELSATVRYLRLVPDARSAPLDAKQSRLVVQAQLAQLVFAAQGQAPFELRAGAPDAKPSALPAATLVPALDEERARFGRATLGEWREVAEVAQKAEADQRKAALRPWLLWSVLLLGVAALGFMVLKLARSPAAPS